MDDELEKMKAMKALPPGEQTSEKPTEATEELSELDLEYEKLKKELGK